MDVGGYPDASGAVNVREGRMKKILLFLMATVFCGGMALAEETAPVSSEHPMKDKMDKMGKMGMMGMKGGMGGREIVATTDGGIVVLVGNKLVKLKKEVEIKIDREAMKKMMSEGGANCPMMGKDSGMSSSEAPKEATASEGTSTGTSETPTRN
jgi:hypothetical protein